MPTDEKSVDFHTSQLGKPTAQPMPNRGTRPLDRLLPQAVVLRVMGSTNVLHLPMQEYVIIGRYDQPGIGQADVDLTPHGAQEHGVSRQHIVITMRADGVTVKDLKSTNGTFLNGYGLNPLQTYRLRHGDRLTLGRLMLQVLFDNGSGE